MIVAIDSSVLFAIFKSEPPGAGWLEFLLRLRRESQLVACDIVWAEVAPLFENLERLRSQMAGLGVAFSPIDDASAFLAGQLFARYRQARGPRQKMIPDFMIAAHAMKASTGLATLDDGYMRAHFPKLRIFKP